MEAHQLVRFHMYAAIPLFKFSLQALAPGTVTENVLPLYPWLVVEGKAQPSSPPVIKDSPRNPDSSPYLSDHTGNTILGNSSTDLSMKLKK